jgi:hypothetical protein
LCARGISHHSQWAGIHATILLLLVARQSRAFVFLLELLPLHNTPNCTVFASVLCRHKALGAVPRRFRLGSREFKAGQLPPRSLAYRVLEEKGVLM